MTRFKEYLKTKGFKFENDFPYIPNDEGLESVVANVSPACTHLSISYYYNCFGVEHFTIDRAGNVTVNTEF